MENKNQATDFQTLVLFDQLEHNQEDPSVRITALLHHAQTFVLFYRFSLFQENQFLVPPVAYGFDKQTALEHLLSNLRLSFNFELTKSVDLGATLFSWQQREWRTNYYFLDFVFFSNRFLSGDTTPFSEKLSQNQLEELLRDSSFFDNDLACLYVRSLLKGLVK